MRHWWSGIALLALGVCVIVLLSLVQPAASPQTGSAADRLFVPIPSDRLVDEGIVDLLDPLPLVFGLDRVRWEPGILNVDLSAKTGVERPEDLLGDAYELCRASFERVNNVRQLLVRFYAYDGGRTAMLASADLRAADWAELGGGLQGNGARDATELLKNRMVWTATGREWLANFAF